MASKTQFEKVFEQVVLSDDWNELIHALPPNTFALNKHRSSRRADYLWQQRQMIVETKSLTGNRAQLFNDWLNRKAQTDRWLQDNWLDSEHAEDLFARHPKGTKLKAQALDYFYGSVLSNSVQKAMPQLRATKQVMSLPNAMCGVVLLNGTDDSFEALELEMTLAKHLSKRGEDGSRLCGPIDFVLLVSQTPKDTASKRLYLGLIIAPDCACPDMVDWYVMQSLRYRWASEHGLALAPVQANRG